MDNFFSINKQDFYRGRINNDQTINERNKVVEDFMNDMDDKNNENNNLEDEEEDDFDKMENEYYKKREKEKNEKSKSDTIYKFKEEENEEKEINNNTNNNNNNIIKKSDFDIFYNNEENINKNNFQYRKQFYPKLYQNPEKLYLMEINKKKEKKKMKQLYEKKIRKIEYDELNKNKENEKLKKQNIRIFKTGKKIDKESRSLSKTKLKNGKKEDIKNQDSNNESFEEIQSLLSKYRNNKAGIKSGRIRRPSNKGKKLFENFQNINPWNNQINNFQNNNNQYDVNNKLKNECFLPPIYNPIQSKYENMFNGNKTFTTFSNINGFNQLNEKKRSKSKNKKRNFESIYNNNNNYNNNYNTNYNDNQIQFDFILNHFEKKDD